MNIQLSPEIRAIVRRSQRQAGRRQLLLGAEQAAIAVLSIIGIALVDLGQGHERLVFWGNVIGLAGQPLWLRCTAANRQFGMLAAAVVTTLVWAAGAWLHH